MRIDVRLLNHPNRTSISQVMVYFLGLLKFRLFNGLFPDFGTVRGLVSELSSELCCGQFWFVVWNVLWAFLCHNWS